MLATPAGFVSMGYTDQASPYEARLLSSWAARDRHRVDPFVPAWIGLRIKDVAQGMPCPMRANPRLHAKPFSKLSLRGLAATRRSHWGADYIGVGHHLGPARTAHANPGSTHPIRATATRSGPRFEPSSVSKRWLLSTNPKEMGSLYPAATPGLRG